MSRVFRTCRHCGDVSSNTTYSEALCLVLCAECHIDLVSKAQAHQDEPLQVETRAWTPRETGVLKYSPFRASLQGGGR